MTYYRYPGYSPTYTRFETALYVSRKARLMRGFALSPTRHNGNQYYFRSPRGPMKDMGNWIVTVGRSSSLVPNPIYFPDYDGAPFDPPESHTRSSAVNYYIPWFTAGEIWVQQTKTTRLQDAIDEFGAENVVPNVHPDYVGRWPAVRANLHFDIPADDPLWYHSTGYHAITTLPDYSHVSMHTENHEMWPDLYRFRATLTHRHRFAPNCGYLSERYLRSGWVLLHKSRPAPQVMKTPSTSRQHWWLYTYADDGQLSCIYEGPQVEGNDQPLVPSGGGGGGDANEVNCAGSATYSCTCPDYTAEEHPYWDARTRSLTQYRTWAGGNWAGIKTLGFPCKHIIATAYKRRDWPNLFCWAREASNDLPARELWQQARDSYLEYRDRYWAQRDRDAARAADRRRARHDQYQRDEWQRRLEPRRELQAQISGVYARIKELSEPMDWQYALTDAGKREAMQRDRERQELTGQLKDLTLQVEAFDAQLDRERTNRALIDSGHTIKYGTPPPSASAGERMQAAIDQLAKVDDTARFIANEGAKYGWGSHVSGADPFAPPQYLE